MAADTPSGRGPHPCQHPDCLRPAVAQTRWTYCDRHRDCEPGLCP